MRAVNQYTLNGQYVKTYKSMKDAADAVGVSACQIYQCANRRNKYKINTCNGYCFRYADENGDEEMNNIELNMKNGQTVSFSNEEAKVATKFFRVMLNMLIELEKNPRMISTMKQALYDSIKEIENAQSKTEEENAEENSNKTEWKPFLAEN